MFLFRALRWFGRIRILPPGSRPLGRFQMRIGGRPSTGLGVGCRVVPWPSSRRTMKRRKTPRTTLHCSGGAVPKYAPLFGHSMF
jgi:hypothetical protein